MSIVTFWNNGKEQVGKTLTIAALVTQYAIEHNKKTLVISTSLNDDTLKNCFWETNRDKKGFSFFGKNSNIGIENGIDGLVKILRSNKITPNIITDYTKIVFKDRLEVLLGYVGDKTIYEEVQDGYLELIKLADQYYDMVFVDLDNQVSDANKKEILRASDVVVMPISQRLKSINTFLEDIEEEKYVEEKKVIPLVCRYDKKSKYTVKNIARYMGKRINLNLIPYNTLLFEAAEEGKIVEFFLKIRNVDETDKSAYFLREVKKTIDVIMYKIEELQMR